MGFYVHDVQPTEGTGVSKTIIKSPTARRLKGKELCEGGDERAMGAALHELTLCEIKE